MNDRAIRPEFLKQDLSAGFVVFLVALPLCLGLSLASEVPLLSGLITGIVAGLLVSLLSGSHLSVSGPAAGLTMTVIAGQKAIGSFEGLFIATALSGVFQLLFGFLRFGHLANFFPSSVIKGMLAGIGVIIIFKQVPHAVGWHQGLELEESVFCLLSPFCAHSTTSSFWESVQELTAPPVLLAISSIALILWWDTRAAQGRLFFRLVPGPLAAVIVGICLQLGAETFFPPFALQHDAGHLVSLPTISGLSDLVSGGPKLGLEWISNGAVWMTAFAIAIIGSIETLLCLEATDKLDPLRRVSRPNRELTAQGIGNIVAGLLGGIPMTSVIVRSSANVYAGARTRLASFFHGAFLLLSVVFIPGVLNLIPISVLAGILILVGYKLANVKLIRGIYAQGLDQFLPFLITAGSVVVFDLLTGVMIGSAIGLLVVLRMNHHSAYTTVHDGDNYYIRFAKDVSFLQKMSFKRTLARIPAGSSVFIDAGGALFIDHDILELLEDFQRSAAHRQLQVTVRNISASKFSIFLANTAP